MKKWLSVLVCIALVCTIFAGCSGGGSEASPEAPAESSEAASESSSEAPAESSEASEEPSESAAASGDAPVVGISTGSSGTTFRDTMTQALVEVGDEYKAAGRIADYKIVDNATNGDATEQANIIRDFISQGVDIILLNPNSSDALNGVIAEAQAADILVLSYDGTCTAEDVLTVQVSPYDWNQALVSYVAEQMPEGTAIDIYGLDGHPGNIQRLQARDDVLADYPGIELLTETSGGWDQTVAKEAAAQIIASGMIPDIVFTQDSMAYGVLSAFMDQGQLPKIMVGEPGTAYFKLWKELRDQGADFKSCAMPNPPGISGTGFRIAVNLFEGKEFKDGVIVDANDADTFFYEVKGFYTDDNFDEGWAMLEDKPDDYMMTEYISEEDLQQYFK